jgi:hypothetical protein
MRCRSCGKRWHLRDELGPGGSASPGQYLCVGLGVLGIAAGLYFYSALEAVIFGAVGLLIVIMGSERVRLSASRPRVSRIGVPVVWSKELDLAVELLIMAIPGNAT